MNIVILGPQGSGKGTQAKKIADYLSVPHISTGDIFRENIKNQTELGKKVRQIIDQGGLVPDELTVQIVKDRLSKKDCRSGFILDGFPRNAAQAKVLDLIAKIHLALEISLSDKEAISRISGRRTCRNCGAIFHTQFSPPKKVGICDKCSGQLYQRDDDKEEAIKKRLRTYHEQTAPLIEFYKKKGVLKEIDGAPLIDNVFGVIQNLIS